ncbi:MAG: SH3 domain-containing protein [Chloroflexi bacterium]|nr:SH3 domain-containing protein [Chloroflexota bacterium]MDA8188839.1 SH3 domain-containing protein [Dehalococcoidales bacterium]
MLRKVVDVARNPDRRISNADDGVDITVSAVFVITMLLFAAVGITLFFGSAIVISGFSSNPMLNVISAKAELPTSIPKPVTRIDLTSLTPRPAPTITPTIQGGFVKIANTGGDGVFLRRTPRSNDKLVAWMDGTILQIVGENREAEGIVWRNVKDPKGNIGWVPAQYLIDVAQ